ncbi:MAG TPA: glutathione S-transferase family protein [Burkholderiales bacterium]|nr:glutathione S-transferase family protein [Burkholderiales bacterium]
MAARILVIGNRNYSSWSLRPWLFLKQNGIAFEEVRVSLYQTDSKKQLLRYSPSGKVPVLIEGEMRVWDSLAILEYLAEAHPRTGGWPADSVARATARSVCAEMHSGFPALRQNLSMNVRKLFAPRTWPPEVNEDIERIQSLWQSCRERHEADGPFLFGRFSVADAMYAPVVWRFVGYSVPLTPGARAYCDTMLALRPMQEWQAAARAEAETLPQFEMAP